jgi:predicted DNA-binding protein (MmcQ/YjbR family)
VDHPRMYDDADPLLARLRELAGRFPESSEVEAWGRPTFRAGKKLFAVYGDHVGPHSMIFKPDPDERPALLGDPRFTSPPYFGPSGWLALDLAAPDVDWGEVRELLDSSYRQVALVRMLRALDDVAPGTPASPGDTPREV